MNSYFHDQYSSRCESYSIMHTTGWTALATPFHIILIHYVCLKVKRYGVKLAGVVTWQYYEATLGSTRVLLMEKMSSSEYYPFSYRLGIVCVVIGFEAALIYIQTCIYRWLLLRIYHQANTMCKCRMAMRHSHGHNHDKSGKNQYETNEVNQIVAKPLRLMVEYKRFYIFMHIWIPQFQYTCIMATALLQWKSTNKSSKHAWKIHQRSQNPQKHSKKLLRSMSSVRRVCLHVRPFVFAKCLVECIV